MMTLLSYFLAQTSIRPSANGIAGLSEDSLTGLSIVGMIFGCGFVIRAFPALIKAAESTSVRRCARCKMVFPSEARYCRWCGSKV